MFLSYLVENFFMVISRPRILFVLQKFSKQNWFLGQFSDILQVVPNPALEKPYAKLEGWFFRQWKLSVFRYFFFLTVGDQYLTDRLESTLKRTGRVYFLMSVLETMGKLYTVRSLECQNWSTLKVNLKSSFGSLETLQYIINP
jgi:hypothetical protein